MFSKDRVCNRTILSAFRIPGYFQHSGKSRLLDIKSVGILPGSLFSSVFHSTPFVYLWSEQRGRSNLFQAITRICLRSDRIAEPK